MQDTVENAGTEEEPWKTHHKRTTINKEFAYTQEQPLINRTGYTEHSVNMASKYHIRRASSHLEDGRRFLEFCDSQLPHLAFIGSEGQWGTESLSAGEKAQEKYRNLVERSEEGSTWGDDWIRFFFLETEIDESALPDNVPPSMVVRDPQRPRPAVAVAAMILEGICPEYVRPVLKQDDQDPWVYVRFLVTNRSVGPLSKGAGQILLEHAEEVARALPVSRICLDGWNGNGRMLVK